MPYGQSILKLMGIKDKMISFGSCELEELPLGDQLTRQKVIDTTLQAPRHRPCPRCESTTISWGSRPSKIPIPQAFAYPILRKLLL